MLKQLIWKKVKTKKVFPNISTITVLSDLRYYPQSFKSIMWRYWEALLSKNYAFIVKETT